MAERRLDPGHPGPGLVLLDGSMGQELINRGAGGHGLLWAAEALFEAPDTVLAIHRDYIEAGADVITTNSYSAIRNKFEPAGLAGRLEEMNRLAGQLAVRAREASGADVLIAGSLPPQRGSYRPDLVAEPEELRRLYREQAGFLEAYVDLFICETMSSIREAEHAATAALETGKPVWVSFTLQDEPVNRLRSGETLTEAVVRIAPLGVSAVLVNCSPPESITRAVAELVRLCDLPVGAYANGFTPIPERWDYHGDQSLPPSRRDLGPSAYSAFAAQWVRDGATIIGGCCEIGPAHIRALRAMLDGAGRSLTGA
jgi:S-methylmethionine-dependent homocysteine/selenocysteine methylase